MKDIEINFKKEFEKIQAEIQKHIENARNELKEAVKLSEKTGIPFVSNIVEFEQRGYLPKSFFDKWKSIKNIGNIIENEDFYLGEYFGSDESDKYGWQYWNSSSLTC
jgi:hypothetical protein